MMGIVPEQTASSVLHQCIPLYTLLAALGNPTVHWFILDIEGAELQVLHADLFIITAHTALHSEAIWGVMIALVFFAIFVPHDENKS